MSNGTSYLTSGASFSVDRTYRYYLYRTWEENPSYMAVIGLNPSTADETVDDPTVKRCINFAKREGYGGLFMLNLFAFRATDPKAMMAHPNPVGSWNDSTIFQITDSLSVGHVVAAWGNHGAYRNRAHDVLSFLLNDPIHCFGVTSTGQPKHPLYLRADTPLVPYDYSTLISTSTPAGRSSFVNASTV